MVQNSPNGAIFQAFPSFYQKTPTPIQENTPKYGIQHPLNFKETKNQIPPRMHFQKTENMINLFFSWFKCMVLGYF